MDDSFDEDNEEMVMLRGELLAREFILAAMVQKLGGKVTLTKQDMDDLMFIIGTPKHIMEVNGGMALQRKKIDASTVEYELIVKVEPQKGMIN